MKKILIPLLFSVVFFPSYSIAKKTVVSNIDSLLIQIKESNADTNTINNLNDLSLAYFKLKMPDVGLKFGIQGLNLSNKIKWEPGIAMSNYSIGNNYFIIKNYLKAIEYYLKSASQYKELQDKENYLKVILDLARSYNRIWNYPKAMSYYQKALNIAEELGNKERIAQSVYGMANMMSFFKSYSKALVDFKKAEILFRELDNKLMLFSTIEALCETYNNIGNHKETIRQCLKTIKEEENYRGDKSLDVDGLVTARRVMADSYRKQGMIAEAIAYNFAARDIALKNNIALWELVYINRGLGLTLLNAAQMKSPLIASNTFQEDTSIQRYLNIKFMPNTPNKKLDLSIYYLKNSLEKSVDNSELTLDCTYGLSLAYKLKRDYKNAFLYQNMYLKVKDSYFGDIQQHKMAALEIDRIVEINKKEKRINNLELKNARTQQSILFIGLLLLILTSGLFYIMYRMKHKANKSISLEKARSDELLLNILPFEIAEELKTTGTTKAKVYDNVTVLFTDFKNFTIVSENLTAQELVNDINYYYSAFDDIITKHGIEKIKTIGDSYMCVGGLPEVSHTHAISTVNVALEIRDFVEIEKQKRITENKPYFEIRIGCNSGPVIAGIVGTKKFAYDIWGDTVNIASRMESSCETGKINISETTYQLVKDNFKCVHRGKIEAKNKGIIDMYFVES